jgi:hypothetical protein
MLVLLLLLAAVIVLGIVLAGVVIKWLFILAVVAAIVWLVLFLNLLTERSARASCICLASAGSSARAVPRRPEAKPLRLGSLGSARPASVR